MQVVLSTVEDYNNLPWTNVQEDDTIAAMTKKMDEFQAACKRMPKELRSEHGIKLHAGRQRKATDENKRTGQGDRKKKSSRQEEVSTAPAKKAKQQRPSSSLVTSNPGADTILG